MNRMFQMEFHSNEFYNNPEENATDERDIQEKQAQQIGAFSIHDSFHTTWKCTNDVLISSELHPVKESTICWHAVWMGTLRKCSNSCFATHFKTISHTISFLTMDPENQPTNTSLTEEKKQKKKKNYRKDKPWDDGTVDKWAIEVTYWKCLLTV